MIRVRVRLRFRIAFVGSEQPYRESAIGVNVRVRVDVRFRCFVDRVRRGGLLPTTSHSIFYGRVGQIDTFSH